MANTQSDSQKLVDFDLKAKAKGFRFLFGVDEAGREKEARFSMLERLADYDDELMEELLGDMEPPRDRVFDDLLARCTGTSTLDRIEQAHHEVGRTLLDGLRRRSISHYGQG